MISVRRQRKRIAAARAAAAASVSPPHQEETSRPCDSTETEFEQFSPLIRRTDHSDHYQTDAITPPLAVASLAHGDDMRWNPNDNGIDFNP